MTGVKVVDASALAALLFGEPEAEAVAERLDSVVLLTNIARFAIQAEERNHYADADHAATRGST